jgi:hypothetical protein
VKNVPNFPGEQDKKGMGTMLNQYEFCPKCQGMQRTNVTIGLQKTIRPGSLEGERLLLHLHCHSCNTYIRSVNVVEGQEVAETSALPEYSIPEEKFLSTKVSETV